jgi:hypothetical protein
MRFFEAPPCFGGLGAQLCKVKRRSFAEALVTHGSGVGARRSSRMHLPLELIGLKHGTDRAVLHHDFLRFYERFFKEFRDSDAAILEIGVAQGASVRMWADYFHRGTIIGLDIDPMTKRLEHGRIIIKIADQSDAPALADIGREYGPSGLVLDDGSHIWSDQITTLRALLPFVKPGGYNVLEDLDTSYGRYVKTYSRKSSISAAEYVKRLVDYMVAGDALRIPADEEDFIRGFARRLEFVAFFRGTCLIRLRGLFSASEACT